MSRKLETLVGFAAPLNQFAYMALVFEDLERPRWVA
jgi:hypothetical protein